MVAAHFFLGPTHLGNADLPTNLTTKPGFRDDPASTAYFCSVCGDVWARIVVDEAPEFEIKLRRCSAHGSGLLQRGVGTLWQHFPKPILLRELHLIAQHYQQNPDRPFQSLVFTG